MNVGGKEEDVSYRSQIWGALNDVVNSMQGK